MPLSVNQRLGLGIGAATVLFYFSFVNGWVTPQSRCASYVVGDAPISGQGKRVLVTGAAGFIGTHVAAECIKLGMTVVAVDDMSGGFNSNIPQGATYVTGDLKDPYFVEALFKQHGPFDIVYHLAAYAAEGLSHFIRSYNYRNNLVASVEILNQAVKSRTVKTFVFTSSIAVYGTNQIPMLEETIPQPEDPYGVSKYAFELDLRAAHEMFKIDYIVFRPHNVYGPNQNIADRYRNVIGIFINQILRNQPLSIFGDGEQTRAFSYIDDVAPVIARSPLVRQARNTVYNIGADHPYTLNELASEVSAAMGVPLRVVKMERRNEVDHAEAGHRRAHCMFGIRPENAVTLREGLKRTVAWVKEQVKGEGLKPVEFVALEVLQSLPPAWMRPDLKEATRITHSAAPSYTPVAAHALTIPYGAPTTPCTCPVPPPMMAAAMPTSASTTTGKARSGETAASTSAALEAAAARSDPKHAGWDIERRSPVLFLFATPLTSCPKQLGRALSVAAASLAGAVTPDGGLVDVAIVGPEEVFARRSVAAAARVHAISRLSPASAAPQLITKAVRAVAVAAPRVLLAPGTLPAMITALDSSPSCDAVIPAGRAGAAAGGLDVGTLAYGGAAVSEGVGLFAAVADNFARVQAALDTAPAPPPIVLPDAARTAFCGMTAATTTAPLGGGAGPGLVLVRADIAMRVTGGSWNTTAGVMCAVGRVCVAPAAFVYLLDKPSVATMAEMAELAAMKMAAGGAMAGGETKMAA